MYRLESIKERLQQDFYVKSHPTWGKDDTASKDVEYLLQRLEIAQKALEGVVNVIHVQGEHRDIGEQSQWDEALLFKVREALDQLKE